jgi:hypothetical protein
VCERKKLAGGNELPHQRLGLRRHRKAESCRETRDAQDAQRVLRERRRDVPQDTGRQVGGPAAGIDQRAVLNSKPR